MNLDLLRRLHLYFAGSARVAHSKRGGAVYVRLPELECVGAFSDRTSPRRPARETGRGRRRETGGEGRSSARVKANAKALSVSCSALWFKVRSER